MPTVNLTGIQNSTGLVDMIGAVNTNTDGAFGLGLILATFIILVVISSRYGMIRALAVSSWASLLISLLLFAVNMGNVYVSILFLLMSAGLTVKLYNEQNG